MDLRASGSNPENGGNGVNTTTVKMTAKAEKRKPGKRSAAPSPARVAELTAAASQLFERGRALIAAREVDACRK
jgi:hypothetical protein